MAWSFRFINKKNATTMFPVNTNPNVWLVNRWSRSTSMEISPNLSVKAWLDILDLKQYECKFNKLMYPFLQLYTYMYIIYTYVYKCYFRMSWQMRNCQQTWFSGKLQYILFFIFNRFFYKIQPSDWTNVVHRNGYKTAWHSKFFT